MCLLASVSCWLRCDADRSRDSASLVRGCSNVVLAGLVALRAPPIGKKENPLTSGGCFDNFALRKPGWTPPPAFAWWEEGGALLTLRSRGRMDTRRRGSVRLYFWGVIPQPFRGSIRAGRQDAARNDARYTYEQPTGHARC